jgi:hypothetical protein
MVSRNKVYISESGTLMQVQSGSDYFDLPVEYLPAGWCRMRARFMLIMR